MKKWIVDVIFILSTLSSITCVSIVSNEENYIRKIISSFKNGPKKQLFKVYHLLFEKEYDLNSEEGIHRYKTFKQNLKFHKEHNSTPGVTFQLGIGPFTDLTNQEFSDKYLMQMNNNPIETNTVTVDDDYYPDIDYTEYFTPIRRQFYCGSCWAFGSIASIEANYKLKTGKTLELSEQELLDCDSRNRGCRGGYEDRAFDYVKKNGITLRKLYEYTSGDTSISGVCKKKGTPRYNIVTGWEECKEYECNKKKLYDMLKVGPLSVGVDGEGNGYFKEYQSGYYYFENSFDYFFRCHKINHAVNVAAYINIKNPDRKDHKAYWKLRNSWGDQWGHNGYMYMIDVPDAHGCLVHKEAFRVNVIEAEPSPDPPKPEPKPLPPKPEPIPEPPKPKCPILYNEQLYKGKSEEVCKTNAYLIFPMKKILSYRIGDVRAIYLFTEPLCGGNVLKGTHDNIWISVGNNMKTVQSVYVDNWEEDPKEGCLWLWEKDCQVGKKVEICQNTPNLSVVNFLYKTKSMRAGKRVGKITFYKKKNYEGEYYETMEENMFTFAGTYLSGDVQSIKFELR